MTTHTPAGRGGPFSHGQQPGSHVRGVAPTSRAGIVIDPPVIFEGSWPNNEPSGLSPVFSGHPTANGTLIDGSNLDYDYTGQGGSDLGTGFNFSSRWTDGTSVVVTTSSGSRYANVIRKNLYIDDTAGWNGVSTISVGNFPNDYEELYFREIFKYSDNWQFEASGEKMWMFGDPGDIASSFYTGRSGSGFLQFRNQSSNTGGGGLWRSQSITIDRGEWHTYELHVVAQSALGQADGSFQVWWDDVEVTDWTFLINAPAANAVKWFKDNYGSRLWAGLQLPLYWGGSVSTKTVNDHLDIAEFYITGKVPS